MSGQYNIPKKRSMQINIWRWGVWLIIGLIVIALELFDHYKPGVSYFSDVHFLREVSLYGIFLPLGGYILFTLLERANAERKVAVELLQKRKAFAQRLGESISWEQLTRVVVQFPQTVLPVLGTSLLVNNPNNNHLELVTEWRSDGVASNPSTQSISDACSNCQVGELSTSGKLVSCDYIVDYRVLNECRRFCLPLFQSGRRLAILYLDFLPEFELNKNHSELISGVAPIITMAIERGLLEQSALQQANISEADQRHIAQEMHDTLAQNIAYLRLKLDQFSTDDALGEIKQISQELERMRGIADEAYQQVRGTLDALHISPTKEFQELLQETIQQLQERTPIHIQFDVRGQLRPLSPQVKRQAFFICREALNNAIAHSEAQNIRVSVTWADRDMIVNISDDGRGFNTELVQEGHYGLAIMRDRAEDIYSKLDIISASNKGTQVILQVPQMSIPEIGWPQCAPAKPANLS
jgi:nitrate/nitrite-specific signal transduction histidine kinase